ncbi:MAG: hypothetical protein NVSMB16_04470 [Acidimicrobiales bacterium]
MRNIGGSLPPKVQAERPRLWCTSGPERRHKAKRVMAVSTAATIAVATTTVGQ